MKRICRTLLLAGISAVFGACGGQQPSGVSTDKSPLRLEMLRPADDLSEACLLKLDHCKTADHEIVSIYIEDATELSHAYFRLHYNPAILSPADFNWQLPVEWTNEGQQPLTISVLDRPGTVHAGVTAVHPGSCPGFSGSMLLASIRFERRPMQEGRLAARVPELASSATQLNYDESQLRLAWYYANTGDYDQNGEVNVADLTPIGQKFGASNPAGGAWPPADVLSQIDGDGNGEINIADITPIGQNLLSSAAGGYNIYTSTGNADYPDTGNGFSNGAGSTLVANINGASPLADADNFGQKASQRLQFSMQLTLPLPGSHFWVRPTDGAQDGRPSTLVGPLATDFTGAQTPAGGSQQVSAENLAVPALLSMPAGVEGIQQGAPLIFARYDPDPGEFVFRRVRVYWFTDGNWQMLNLLEDARYADYKAYWLAAEQQVMLITYNMDVAALQDIRFEFGETQFLEEVSRTAIYGNSGLGALPFNQMSVDHDSDSGQWGVVHSYQLPTEGYVLWSWLDSGGSWQNAAAPVHDADVSGCVDFHYDPDGSDPWLVMTSGIWDIEFTSSLDTILRIGRLSGGSWNFETLDNPDSPLRARLQFGSDGVRRIAFNSAREKEYTLPFVGDITVDVLFDLMLAEDDGSGWQSSQLFEGTIAETVGETLEDLTLDVDGAAELLWAADGLLMYHRQIGDVLVSLPAFTVLEGDITNQTYLLQDAESGLVPSDYFSGETGGGFSWQQAGSQTVCAYISADVVNIEDELLQFFQPTGPLVYWSP